MTWAAEIVSKDVTAGGLTLGVQFTDRERTFVEVIAFPRVDPGNVEEVIKGRLDGLNAIDSGAALVSTGPVDVSRVAGTDPNVLVWEAAYAAVAHHKRLVDLGIGTQATLDKLVAQAQAAAVAAGVEL